MQSVYRNSYNGVLLTLVEGKHYPTDFHLNGLTDFNARTIINEIMNRESHRLPLPMFIYELGNVFTATLHAASHKYTAFVGAVAKPDNRIYLKRLIQDTRLDMLASVLESPTAGDNTYREYMKMLRARGISSLDAVAVIVPDRNDDELEQLKISMGQIIDYCDSVYFITSSKHQQLPNFDGFELVKESSFYHYRKQVAYDPRVLAMRSMVAMDFYRRQVERNINSYTNFVGKLVERLTTMTDLNQPENQAIKDRLIRHYTSARSMEVFQQAITASDYSVKRSADRKMNDYEVYEMLGDRVLESGLVHYLKNRFPNITQEELTNLKIYFLSTQQQQRIALELGLTRYLISGFKTDLEDIYEDIFEAFTEALVIVGNQLAPGLGTVMADAFISYIFQRIPIDPGDKKYKSAITRVKELYSQMKRGQPRYEAHDTGNSFTVALHYDLRLNPPKSTLPPAFAVDVNRKTITGVGRSKRELKEQVYQILWEMLEEAGYRLEKDAGYFPKELADSKETFLRLMKDRGGTDYYFRLTPAKGRSHGVSGVLELLIDEVWTPVVSAVSTDAKSCYQLLFQYFVATSTEASPAPPPTGAAPSPKVSTPTTTSSSTSSKAPSVAAVPPPVPKVPVPSAPKVPPPTRMATVSSVKVSVPSVRATIPRVGSVLKGNQST